MKTSSFNQQFWYGFDHFAFRADFVQQNEKMFMLCIVMEFCPNGDLQNFLEKVIQAEDKQVFPKEVTAGSHLKLIPFCCRNSFCGCINCVKQWKPFTK